MKIGVIWNIALCIIFLITHNAISIAQVNLVSNPSFEEIYGCPDYGGQIDSAKGWSTFISGGGGSPDFFHVCCTAPYACGVPLNSGYYSFQYPHSGNAYCDVQVVGNLSSDYREYIQSKLIKGLSATHTYCVKFYTNLTDHSLAYIKPLGAYFDDGIVSAPPPYGLAVASPQVYNTFQPLNDTVNWIKIEGSFTSTGTETYISLGNFFLLLIQI